MTVPIVIGAGLVAVAARLLVRPRTVRGLRRQTPSWAREAPVSQERDVAQGQFAFRGKEILDFCVKPERWQRRAI